MAAKAPVGLIHCALGKASNWRGLLDALGPDVSPLQIELPGHGLAEDWDKSRDFSDQALEMALEELPVDPVPIIGHSFGAVLALRLAVERPYRVSSLVLIEPVFFAAAKGRWGHDKAVRDLASFHKKMKASQFATAAKEFHALWGDGRNWSDLTGEQKAYVLDRIELVPPGDPLLMDDLPGLLRKGRLEALDIPVTFVDGGDSHPVIADIISELGDRMKDAEWVTVPKAGHMVPITHPDLVAEGIRERLVWDTPEN
ncbi:MAG: alpha/beta hydrolase [Silicimonas sp.]|nr:alpha/beta hydrolase [Silicimonas sp.]